MNSKAADFVGDVNSLQFAVLDNSRLGNEAEATGLQILYGSFNIGGGNSDVTVLASALILVELHIAVGEDGGVADLRPPGYEDTQNFTEKFGNNRAIKNKSKYRNLFCK